MALLRLLITGDADTVSTISKHLDGIEGVERVEPVDDLMDHLDDADDPVPTRPVAAPGEGVAHDERADRGPDPPEGVQPVHVP